MTKAPRWSPSEMPKEQPRGLGLVSGENAANSSEISK